MSKTQPQKTDETASELDSPDTLPAKHDLALRALISHPTYKEAAKASGISETTLWRYMQDKTFARRLTALRCEAVNHLLARLQSASADAARALHEIVRDKGTPAPARISAARAIIDYSLRGIEADELHARIRELEDFIREQDEGEALTSAKEGSHAR